MAELTRVSTPIEWIICPDCGIPFGTPIDWMRQRRFDGTSFYCPNGHSQSFHDNERTKLREEVDRLSSLLVEEEDRAAKAEHNVFTLEQAKNGYKGIIAKLTNEARNLREQLKLEEDQNVTSH